MQPNGKKYRLSFRIEKVHIWRPGQNFESIKFVKWNYYNYIDFTVSLNFYTLTFTKLTRNMYKIIHLFLNPAITSVL